MSVTVVQPGHETAVFCRRALYAARTVLALAVIPVVFASCLAGCTKKAVEMPASEPPAEDAPTADAKAGMDALGRNFSCVAIPTRGGFSWQDSWDRLLADRKASPLRDDQMLGGLSWKLFKEGAAGRKGKDLLDYVHTWWGSVALTVPHERGDISEEWKAPADILGSSLACPMAAQASVAAAKYFTLRDLGWPSDSVWVTAIETPESSGRIFVACARDEEGRTWFMNADRWSQVRPLDDLALAYPGAAPRFSLGAGLSVMYLKQTGQGGILASREDVVGTSAHTWRGLVRGLGRLGGTRSGMPSPVEKELVLKPGQPVVHEP